MYKGTLDFDDGDIIEVHSLILREQEIAFDLTATWGEHGRWKRSGIAAKGSLGFASDFQPSQHAQTGVTGDPCQLVFHVTNVTSRAILITGFWNEANEPHAFGGSLAGER